MPMYEFRCLETEHLISKHLHLDAPKTSRQSAMCPIHACAALRVYSTNVQTSTVPGFYAYEDREHKEGPADSGAS